MGMVYLPTGLYASIAVTDATTTWAMGGEVRWDDDGDTQQEFLTYGDSTSDATKTAFVAYDNGPDRIALYNNVSSWLNSALNPGDQDRFTLGMYHDGTTERAVVANGIVTTEASPPARPVPDGTTAYVFINEPNTNPGAAWYDDVWLREDIPSDAFFKAKHDNLHTAGFYTVA